MSSRPNLFPTELSSFKFLSNPSELPNYKNLSILLLECSGPVPSKPCGNNKVKLLYLAHLASDEVKNVSIAI